MFESWKPIVGFEKYSVSDQGNVKRSNKILKPWFDKDNRAYVSLSVNCKITKMLISRLVCLTWHGGPPTLKHQAAHWDGNSKNNKKSNLRWATQTENEQDKKRHGRWNHGAKGSKHRDARLHEQDISEIRRLWGKGLSGPKIAIIYQVDNTTIYNIVKGRTWKHV